MANIANIGLSVDTGGLKEGQAQLKALVPPAKAAETAVDALEQSLEQADAAAAGAASSVKKAGNAFKEAAGGASAAGNAFKGAAGGAGGFRRDLGDFDTHVTAWRNNLKGASKDIKLTSNDYVQFGRQGADVGVSLVGGMNPFMVAVQQLPQILDAAAIAAARNGATTGAVFRALGATIWTAVAPLLPIIVGLGAAFAAVATVWGLATREINKDIGKVTDGMGLTQKQLDHLKEKSIETTVTMGDSFKGLFVTIGQYLKEGFAGPLKWLSDTWNGTLDNMTKYGILFMKTIVGTFVGIFYAIRDTWKLLPGLFGDLGIQAANNFIRGVEIMGNTVIDLLNKLGLSIDHINLPEIANPFAGDAAKTTQAALNGLKQGFTDTGKAFDEFGRRWVANSEKIAQARIKKGAGAPGATGNNKDTDLGFDTNFFERKVSSDFEREFEAPNKAWEKATKTQTEFVKAANATTAALQQEYGYIGMSEDAVTRLRIENDLLAEAKEKNIMLTPEMVSGIKDIATAQADAAIATRKASDELDFAKSTTKSFIGDLRSGLEDGKSIWSSFADAAVRALDRIIDRMIDAQIDKMFEGSDGGGGGWLSTAINAASAFFTKSAKGNVFGTVTPFAKGADFSNSVVTSPTLFSFANGTKLGEMGEAGAEAIMPLQRGPGGSLGVQMYGGDGGGRTVSASVQVDNHYTISGAVSSNDIIQLIRASSEQTKKDVQRSLSTWITEQQNDGTVV